MEIALNKREECGTFYLHTPPEYSNGRGVCLGHRATIAAKLSGKIDDRDVIKYGVSVCGLRDNFSRKIGRELAEKRMNEDYATIIVPTHIASNFDNNCQILMAFASAISEKIQHNYEAAKRKINRTKQSNIMSEVVEEMFKPQITITDQISRIGA